jgi:hypothetical protein
VTEKHPISSSEHRNGDGAGGGAPTANSFNFVSELDPMAPEAVIEECQWNNCTQTKIGSTLSNKQDAETMH